MTGPKHAIDFERGINDAWTTVVTFIPKLLFFVIILLVGFFLATVLAKAVNGILERVGFDRAVERGGVKQALATTKYDASDIVARLVKYTVILFTLVIAFNVFGPNPISDLLRELIAFLPHLIVAIIIIVVAAAVAKAVKDLVASTLGGLSYGNLLATLASVFILFLGVVAALNQIGVATAVTTPLLVTILATIGGVIVVGVGGGLIRPMQSRWEQWLAAAARESAVVKEQATHHRQHDQSAYASPPARSEASAADTGPGATDRPPETRQL